MMAPIIFLFIKEDGCVLKSLGEVAGRAWTNWSTPFEVLGVVYLKETYHRPNPEICWPLANPMEVGRSPGHLASHRIRTYMRRGQCIVFLGVQYAHFGSDLSIKLSIVKRTEHMHQFSLALRKSLVIPLCQCPKLAQLIGFCLFVCFWFLGWFFLVILELYWSQIQGMSSMLSPTFHQSIGPLRASEL